jgi:CRP-like cAMP-binding protein
MKKHVQGAHLKLRAELLLLKKNGGTVFGSKLVKAKKGLDGHTPGQKRNINYRIIAKQPEDRTPEECQHLVDFFLSKVDPIWSMVDKLVIAKHMTLHQSKKKGSVLVKQGDVPTAMYFVYQGVYGVWKEHHVTDVGGSNRVGTLRSGDAFGEISLISGSLRTASILSDGAAEVMVVDKKSFELFQKKRVKKLKENAEFLSTSSMFNDRQAWHVNDLEFLSQRLTFKKFGIHEVLWHAGDPISPIHFVPVIKRGECNLIVTLAKPTTGSPKPLPQISTFSDKHISSHGSASHGDKVQINLCTVGAGAVVLDSSSMEAVDITSRTSRQANKRLYEQQETPQQVRRRRDSLVHQAEKKKKGLVVQRSSELVYGSGRTVPVDEPLARTATLVTTSCVELAWISLQDFDAALVNRRMAMEEAAITRVAVDMKRVAAEAESTFRGPNLETKKWKAAMNMVNKTITENAATNQLSFPPDTELLRLCKEMGVWQRYRSAELETALAENFRNKNTMQPHLAVKKKKKPGGGGDHSAAGHKNAAHTVADRSVVTHSASFSPCTSSQRRLIPSEDLATTPSTASSR